MDIENLKLILETVKGVSGNAQTVAILWIVLDKVLPNIVGLIVFVGLLWKIPIFVHSIIRPVVLFKSFRDALGIGRSGYLMESDIDDTAKKIMELIKEAK